MDFYGFWKSNYTFNNNYEVSPMRKKVYLFFRKSFPKVPQHQKHCLFDLFGSILADNSVVNNMSVNLNIL